MGIDFSPSEIKTYISAIDFWVEKEIALGASVVVAVISSYLVWNEESIPLICKAIAPVAIFTAVMICWAIGRELYFRTGRARKIGIAYEGLNVGLAEWIKLKNDFYALFDARDLKRNISLRRIPISKVKTDDQWLSTAKRYGFTLCFKAFHSSGLHGQPPVWSFNQHSNVRAAIDKKFFDVWRNVFLSQPKFTGSSDLQRLEHQVRGQFESILLHVGYVCFAERDYERALILFRALDRNLNARNLCATVELRKDLRHWMAFCTMSDSFYPGDKPPPAERLTSAIGTCKDVLEEFGSEFPDFFNVQARNLCYALRYPSAIECVDHLIGRHQEIDEKVYRSAILNKGVISLFSGDNKTATECFRKFCDTGGFDGYDLPELIKFADFADGYHSESSIFLRVWYRKVSQIAVPSEMKTALYDWLHGRRHADKYMHLVQNPCFTSRSKGRNNPPSSRRKR